MQKAVTDVGVIMLVGLVILIILIALVGLPFFTGETGTGGFGQALARIGCDWFYYFLGPPCVMLGVPPRVVNATVTP